MAAVDSTQLELTLVNRKFIWCLVVAVRNVTAELTGRGADVC